MKNYIDLATKCKKQRKKRSYFGQTHLDMSALDEVSLGSKVPACAMWALSDFLATPFLWHEMEALMRFIVAWGRATFEGLSLFQPATCPRGCMKERQRKQTEHIFMNNYTWQIGSFSCGKFSPGSRESGQGRVYLLLLPSLLGWVDFSNCISAACYRPVLKIASLYMGMVLSCSRLGMQSPVFPSLQLC